MEGNIKLSIFKQFPLDGFNEVCDAIVGLGYTGTIVDNGNVTFQKIVEEPAPEYVDAPEPSKFDVIQDEIKEIKQKISNHRMKIDNFSNVIHVLQATANNYYSPDDKMWNLLLAPKEKLEKEFDKENEESWKKIDELQQEIVKLKMQREL